MVESADEVVDVGAEEVGVAVHGDGDGGVAEVGLDGLRLAPAAMRRLAQVWRRSWMPRPWESGLFGGRLPDTPPEVPVAEACAVG